MRSWQELEEDGGVDREIPSDTETPEGGKGADGCKVGRGGCEQAEDCSDGKSQIKRQLSSEYIASEAPKHGSGEKTNVLSKRENWWAQGIEFVCDGGH